MHYFLAYSIFKLLIDYLSGNLVGTSGLEPPTSRLSGVRSNRLSYAPISLVRLIKRLVRYPSGPHGGDEEDRTPDPLRARQVLSQLSYTPIFLCGVGPSSYAFSFKDSEDFLFGSFGYETVCKLR